VFAHFRAPLPWRIVQAHRSRYVLSGFALLVGAELNVEIDKAIPGHDDQATADAEQRKRRIGPEAEGGGGR
jgi:hypothetical protein